MLLPLLQRNERKKHDSLKHDSPQVFIAQREFEHAVNLIFRARAFCRENANEKPAVREAGKK